MSLKTFYSLLGQLAVAAGVLILAHYGLWWLAVLVVAAPAAVTWYRAGRSRDALVHLVPQLLAAFWAITLIGLTKPPIGQPVFPVSSQIMVALLYGGWLLYLTSKLPGQHTKPRVWLVAGVNHFMALSAVFLAAAFWRWPDAVLVAACWVIGYLNLLWALEELDERAKQILAATWGLLLAQVGWLLSIWQVNYILFGGVVIIPQAALVTLGMGYCFGSIYAAHSSKKLSRRRLIEYVAITAALLAVVVAGTRWNGTV